MITLSILILTMGVGLVVFVIRFLILAIKMFANKWKAYNTPIEIPPRPEPEIVSNEIPEQDLYVITQLESWSDEIQFNNQMIRKYKERYDTINNMKAMDEKTDEQIRRKIIQLQKQAATAEKNIRKACAKHNLDSEEYLYY